MAWRIAGSYAASCCVPICPCPVDGPPTAPDGECKGFDRFGVKEGSLDDTDLSGVNFALYNLFPSNLTAGNWKVGIVIDSGASDEQADALERICKGEAGGPFGDLANFYGEYLGTSAQGGDRRDALALDVDEDVGQHGVVDEGGSAQCEVHRGRFCRTPGGGSVRPCQPEPLSDLVHPTWVPALEPVADTITAIGEFLRAEVAAGRGYLPAGDHVLRAFERRWMPCACSSSARTPTRRPGTRSGCRSRSRPTCARCPGACATSTASSRPTSACRRRAPAT